MVCVRHWQSHFSLCYIRKCFSFLYMYVCVVCVHIVVELLLLRIQQLTYTNSKGSKTMDVSIVLCGVLIMLTSSLSVCIVLWEYVISAHNISFTVLIGKMSVWWTCINKRKKTKEHNFVSVMSKTILLIIKLEGIKICSTP